jgi:hypothetical protein
MSRCCRTAAVKLVLNARVACSCQFWRDTGVLLQVGIIEEGKLVTFGPYQAEVMSAHMPVDHLLFATVEAGDAAAKKPEHPPSEAEPEQPALLPITRRKSMQRSSCGGMHPISSVEMALNELSAQAEDEEERQMVIVEEAADQTPEDIARLFNGIPKRLTAAQSLRVYIRAGGVALFCFSIFIFATTQTMRVYSDYWIRLWSADYYGYYNKHSQDEASQIYILAYMAFVIMFIVLLLTRDSLFCVFSLITSTRLHNKLFNRVLEVRSPFWGVNDVALTEVPRLTAACPPRRLFVYLCECTCCSMAFLPAFTCSPPAWLVR